jgi:dephospho-CoA kinase
MPRQKANKKKLIIGLTGGFASGKSTVSRCFRDHGALVIDADLLAHRCICPGTRAYRRLLRAFGRGILRPDRRVDRRRLSGIVFSDRKLLRKLNRIVHPEVIREMRKLTLRAKNNLIVFDAPLLLEAGLKKNVDFLVVVKASLANQIKRAALSMGLKRQEILKRVKAQLPMAKKIRQADFVIDNNGTKKETLRQVREIMKRIQGGNSWKS